MSDHAIKQEIYAAELVELLSDVVDVFNEAKADGLIFNFQIAQVAPDGKFALTSLSTTTPIELKPPGVSAN